MAEDMEDMVQYTSYQGLKDFEPSHEFNRDRETFLTLIGDPDDWTKLFQGINALRIMNKYHWGVLMDNLDDFAEFVKTSVDNERQNIAKNALMFCSEFFENKQAINNDKYRASVINFMQVVFPSVLHKTTYDKKFISMEAKSATSYCLLNLIYPELLVIIIQEGCQNIKKKPLVELSYITYLKIFIDEADFLNKKHHFLIDGKEFSKMLI